MSGLRATAGVVASTALLTLAMGGGAASASSASRPAAEHVPASVRHVKVLYDGDTDAAARVLHGAKAKRLVRLFDALKREPRGTVHCDLVGGPTTTVTFSGPKHTWVATEAACTNVQVTRDGKALPTLVPTNAWTNTVYKDADR